LVYFVVCDLEQFPLANGSLSTFADLHSDLR